MQIILQEDVDKLGHRGDVVTVKPGYARNFLLPHKLAVEATAGNLKAIERIRTSLAKKTATELEAAQKQAELLNGVSVKFTRKTGENDQMFGSVTSADVADGLAAQGFKIDKRQVQLGEPIKIIGESDVTIKVFRDVTAQIKVTRRKRSVAPSFSVAELLRSQGHDVSVPLLFLTQKVLQRFPKRCTGTRIDARRSSTQNAASL